MHILVTGGSGFIGSHIVERLLDQGHIVFALDIKMPHKKFVQKIEKYINKKQFMFSPADITTEAFRDSHFFVSTLLGHVDCVIHLAAKASIVPSVKEPVEYFQTNVVGTLNVLELGRKIGVKKFVYAASGSCYGIPDYIPTDEKASIEPMYPYALTKRLAEEMTLHWSKVYGIQAISLRLFNVFGPYMSLSGGYGGLFSCILPQKFNNQPIVTIGDGSQRRDFIYVEDVAEAFSKALSVSTCPEVLNIGAGHSVSVNEILSLLEIPESQVQRLPNRPGEPAETCADIRQAKRWLKWEPKTLFKDGLSKMIQDTAYWRNGKIWTYEESVKSQEEWYKYLGKQGGGDENNP